MPIQPVSTLRWVLTQCNPARVLSYPQELRASSNRGFGDMVGAMYRRNTTIDNSAAAAAASHVHPYPACIDAVQADGGAPLLILADASDTAAAGEVLVVYDANGVPTLTFGDGAIQIYHVIESGSALPTNVLSRLDTPVHQIEVT
mgnify:CR=1 FL=1